MTPTWETFVTADYRAAQRLSAWDRVGSETLCGLKIRPHDANRFEARIERIAIGKIGMIRLRSTPATAVAAAASVGPWSSSENDALLLVVSEGPRTFEGKDRAHKLDRGALFIRDLTKSWTHDCADQIDRLMIKIPYSVLLSRIADPSLLGGQALPATLPAVQMTVDVIRSIYRTLEVEPQPDCLAAAQNLILDCVKMLDDSVLKSAVEPPECYQRVAIRRDAMSFINSNLENPELNVGDVSRALGIGPRRLQRAFLYAGETPARFILSQRLDRAAMLLRQASRAQGSILDVAMSVGFNDASYFSRSFSRRFGVSPRDYCAASVRRPALSATINSATHS